MADLAVRRLVALLGHLTPDAHISIAELAEALGASEAELASDLTTLSVCGIAPYYPDDLMPLIIEDGYVDVWGDLPALSGPIRLSAGEAAALASALQSAGFSAEDGLTSRLLQAAASEAFDAETLEHTIRTADAAHDADVYQTLAKALSDREIVRVEYVRAGSVGSTARDIEPVALFAERGAWYTTAWCRSAGDWRTFRVDRIRSASLTGEAFPARGGETATTAPAAFSGDNLPLAVLRFAPGEAFDEREWPGGRIRDVAPDGSVAVDVPFGGTEWIARRVVARMGRVEVLEPASLRAAITSLAAAERQQL